MRDVDDEVTYTLLRAAGYIKDNRIPPQGFVKSHASYDTVSIVGLADMDDNFNFENAVEGNDTDLTSYSVDIEPNDTYFVSIKLCYQTVTPRFVDHMFAMSTPEITLFQSMYATEDKSPSILDSLSYVIIPPNSIHGNDNSLFLAKDNFISNYQI